MIVDVVVDIVVARPSLGRGLRRGSSIGIANTSATGTVSSSSRCVFFFLDDAPVLARLEIISSFFSSRFPFEDDVDPAVADFDSDWGRPSLAQFGGF